MAHFQPDLFDTAPTHEASAATPSHRLAPDDMSDAELIAALPDSNLSSARALAAEASKRRLRGAVAALVALCKRFHGSGKDRLVPEQAAALEALADIGGRDPAESVREMLVERTVQGPALAVAARAAAQLGVKFPAGIALNLLRNPDPEVRAPACVCVPAHPEIRAALIEMLVDRVDEVAIAAACALGRMGRVETRGPLKRYLRERPSPRVIEALAAIADGDDFVLLARVGRDRPELASAILAAIGGDEDPRAVAAVSKLRPRLANSGEG